MVCVCVCVGGMGHLTVKRKLQCLSSTRSTRKLGGDRGGFPEPDTHCTDLDSGESLFYQTAICTYQSISVPFLQPIWLLLLLFLFCFFFSLFLVFSHGAITTNAPRMEPLNVE